MDFATFTATNDDATRRFDSVVKKMLPNCALSLVYKNIRSGFIRLNGKKAKSSTKIALGDVIGIAKFLCEQNLSTQDASTQKSAPSQSTCNAPSTCKSASPKATKIQTIFINEHIRIIQKPYGVAVHGANSANAQSLDKIIKQEYFEALSKTNKCASLSFAPGPLHRLDKNTTGLLAFSQSLLGAKWFSAHIADHSIQKEYLGVVCGTLQNAQTWIDQIEYSQNESKQKAFCTVRVKDNLHTQNTVRAHNKLQDKDTSTNANANKVRGAITKVTPLSYGVYKGKNITLCKFAIITGRKHQIRAQASAQGFALLGDSAYNAPILLDKSLKREYFLHAKTLIIPSNNPINLPHKIDAPLDEVFKNFLLNCSFNLTDIE